MRDSTKIRKPLEVTMKIGKGETGKKEIWNLTLGVHETSDISGTHQLIVSGLLTVAARSIIGNRKRANRVYSSVLLLVEEWTHKNFQPIEQ